MFKKSMTLILATCMLFTVLAGCKSADPTSVATSTGSSASASASVKAEPVTLTYYCFNGANGHEADLKVMMDDFQKKNEGITVKMEVYAWADYFTKLKSVLSANGAVDVFETNYENFYTYAMSDVLLNLDTVMKADKSFDATMIKKGAYESYKYNSSLYGLCTDFSGCLMYYNKDLFDAKKVAYPTDKWTWKEELAAAQQLTDTAAGVWGTVSPFQAYEFYKTIAQNGGSIWSADNKSVTINSKEVVDAVQWMIDKSVKYKVQPDLSSPYFKTADYDTKAFEQGKVAMIRTGSWKLDEFLKECKFKFDVVVEPGNTAKAHNFFSNANVVTKSTKNPEASWKLLKYLSTDNFSVYLHLNSLGALPVVADESALQPYIAKTPPSNRKAILDIATYAVNVPLGPIPDKWSQVSKIIGDQLDKAAASKLTVQQAMDEAKTSIEALLK